MRQRAHLVERSVELDEARATIVRAARADEVRQATQMLEDAGQVLARVQALQHGTEAPEQRAPCFFNPCHGLSVDIVEWAEADARVRNVPVCAADLTRVRSGADPYVRTVRVGDERVPWWHGGAEYEPWAQGYFGTWTGSRSLGDVSPESLFD